MRKFKKRRKKLYTRKIFLLNSILVVFLFLGIGYSLLSTTLIIGGNLTVNKYVDTSLYNVLKKEAETNGLAKEYTGEHQDSIDASLSTEKIYHWYADNDTEGTNILNKNNVIFANHCWQMVRTTDTGGVKLVYNGVPENGECLNTRGSHVGYVSQTSQNLSSNYWYGTDYVYDSTNQLFSISGVKEQASWNANTWSNLIGKYTCKNANEYGTCSTIYYVSSYSSDNYATVFSIDKNSIYSQFGTLQFNSNDNSMTYVGYKYGEIYETNNDADFLQMNLSTQQYLLLSDTLNTSYWYADSIDYGNIVPNKYSLVNPYQVSSTADYSSLVGKYTFKSTDQSYAGTSVNYIAGVTSSTMYKKIISSGSQISDYDLLISDSITDNGDGTYNLDNPTSVPLSSWYENYNDYIGKYTCNEANNCTAPKYLATVYKITYSYVKANEKILIAKSRNGVQLNETLLVNKDEFLKNSSNYTDYKYTCNSESATCTEENLAMILSVGTNTYTYVINRYHGSSVTWDGSEYTLVDPVEIEYFSNYSNTMATHHYTCIELGKKKCTTVAYKFGGYGSVNNSNMYYIILKDGKIIPEEALEEMLTHNNTDSTIKIGIEEWYRKYILPYDSYIEDTIYCNDRSIKELGGFDPNGGTLSSDLKFNTYSNALGSLICSNVKDRFSINNPSATINYKVGLLTAQEVSLYNNAKVRNTDTRYWLLSPYYYDGNARIRAVVQNGGIHQAPTLNNADSKYGVRPAISLKPGISYTSGDGSMESPYIVDAEAHQYVYSTSDENTRGVLVSELGSTYKTETEAINGFNKRVVLNHRIENDRVASSGVTFERNGIIYTLYGEGSTYNDSTGEYNDDSIYYEENKQTLKNAFGEDKCTEYTTPEKYYECTDGNEIGAARASGRVGVEIDRWYCRDFPDGTFHCKLY